MHINILDTPAYIYDLQLLEQTIYNCKEHASILPSKIYYALKANYNRNVLHTIRKHLTGIECVSQGEIELALSLNIKPNEIILTGAGKTPEEIEYAIEKNIELISVESIEELELVNELSFTYGKQQPVLIRINPIIDPKTHPFISTALSHSKFGILTSEIPYLTEKIHKYKNIIFKGIHIHIGSQITNVKAFEELCVLTNDLVKTFESNDIPIQIIDVGGGFGINYYEPEKEPIPNFEHYFKAFKQNLCIKNYQRVYFELGRSLVGQAGTLLSKVLYIKERSEKNIIILDTSMSHILRPALYGAYHKIKNISKPQTSDSKIYDIYGSSCESSDIIGKNVLLPETSVNDVLAIKSTGAYCEVMVSDYNLKKRPTVYVF